MNKKRRRTEFKGYAVSHITEEVRVQIKKDKRSASDVLKWVSSVVDEGYKFALTYDDANEAYQASLFAPFVDMQNAGLMLSLRHVDINIAINALITVHDEVYQGVWMTKQDFDW